MTCRPVSVSLAVMFAWLLCCAVSGCGRDAAIAEAEAKCDKVKIGMTAAEVEAILGPGGEETSDPNLLGVQKVVEKEGNLPASTKWKKWKVPGKGERVYIGVAFDGDKVVSKAKVNFDE
jgi:hypothetical protein